MSATQNDVPPGAPPRRQLQRSRSDRVVAGVCGGLGDYFDVDPVIFRVAFVVRAFVGGAGFLLYPAAWLLLPEEGHSRSIGEAWVHRGRGGHWLAIALVVVGALILAGQISDHRGGGVGFAVIAIVIGVVLLRRHPAPPPPPVTPSTATPWSTPPPAAVETPTEPPTEPAATPPPPPDTPPPAPPGASWGRPADELRPPKGRSLGGIVLSVLLIGAGTVGLLHAAGAVSVSVPVFLAAALIFTGVALVISGWTGGTGGLIAVAVVLTIALAVASVVRAPLSGGFGERRWVPSTLSEVRSTYKHGGGDVVIDLSHVAFPIEGRSVHARLGVGHLKVIVPFGTMVTADAHTGAGEIRLLGRHEQGVDVDDLADGGIDAHRVEDRRHQVHVGLGGVAGDRRQRRLHGAVVPLVLDMR